MFTARKVASMQRRSPRLLERARASMPPPVVVRDFLSDSDIADLFAFASSLRVVDGEGLVRYGSGHVALFLHHGGAFASAHPALLRKMLTTARNCAHDAGLCSHAVALNVRCVEMHLYQEGGGLTTSGHYDQGSILTFSVQLSPPGPRESGGRFSTSDASGVESVHELGRGDAILFRSEQVHNVSTLARGAERNSLVIELWQGRECSIDRFK